MVASSKLLKPSVKRFVSTALDHVPRAWLVLRWYVRYFPPALVASRVIPHVDRFFAHCNHRFVARTIYGHRVAGTTRDIIQRYLYLFGVWEPNLSSWCASCLSRGDVFVDVGSNIGFFSLLASRAVGTDGRVVSIEPSPTLFAHLTSNIALNRIHNIRLVNCAASDRLGAVTIYRGPARNVGATSTYTEAGFHREAEVEGVPLSDVLSAEEMRRIRLIKIDVEGAEASVVTGLLPLLPYARRDLNLFVEMGGGPQGSPRAGESARRIVPVLAARGFNAYVLENDYEPGAYRRAQAPARPRRLRDLDSITEECDMIFSLQDVEAL